MRHCFSCGASIHLCMGSVLMRDLIAAQEGTIVWTAIRELCGRCTMGMIAVKDGYKVHPHVAAKAARLWSYLEIGIR